MNRRELLKSILALAAAPAIVRAESIMRVRPLIPPADCVATFNAIQQHLLESVYLCAILYGRNGPIATLTPDESRTVTWDAKKLETITDIRLRYGGLEIQHPAMDVYTMRGRPIIMGDGDKLTLEFPNNPFSIIT